VAAIIFLFLRFGGARAVGLGMLPPVIRALPSQNTPLALQWKATADWRLHALAAQAAWAYLIFNPVAAGRSNQELAQTLSPWSRRFC